LAGQVSAPSYPPSPVIEGLRIDADRLSIGNGDNWPVTWADDDYLYTVYCEADGFGAAVAADKPDSGKLAETFERAWTVSGAYPVRLISRRPVFVKQSWLRQIPLFGARHFDSAFIEFRVVVERTLLTFAELVELATY